ncbi:peptidase S10 [Brevundimonas sp.]|uniref:S10 family peptidase n=1 Tax=Brevundimonas sp. TaxID=1871086 RepID=UPI001D32CAE8|nr:peptidase S10 [Brevundimonas sp.]MBA3999423.1 peptidase S10 [Brevundimonas sp.]
MPFSPPNRRTVLAGLAASGGAGTVRAQSTTRETPVRVITGHEGRFNGRAVRYTATLEETRITAAPERPAARFVTTAYVAEPRDPARPVLFLFNGGPIVASSYLHIGAFGPRRYDPPRDVNADVAPPYALVDNSDCPLDVADLVFVDPPETGFSRLEDETDRLQAYSDRADSLMTAEFIQVWLRAAGRETSPVHLVGESYGTLRASLTAGLLSETRPLEGLVLLGQALNMIETSQRAGNILSYATNLPTLTAVAWHHGRISRGEGLSARIEESWAFAMSAYLEALRLGNALPVAESRAMAGRLEALTGIGRDYYLANRLMISKVAFCRELLRDQGLILAMYDARYAGPAPAAGEPATDPYGKVNAMIPPLLARHLTETLGVTLPMADYRASAPRPGPWAYAPSSGAGGPFDDYHYDRGVEQAMAANPRFRLLIGTGVFDTTTTLGPARYLADQAAYPRERLVLREYEGGHMAYSNPDARTAMAQDLRAFVAGPRSA